ncbi:MAG: pyridoxamine 5'-phosphate oxidase family protein [Mariprofundus sp.]|nr:pyridoxamine 5'-phosphate oxidase family protein [Mariprofundus sp.]
MNPDRVDVDRGGEKAKDADILINNNWLQDIQQLFKQSRVALIATTGLHGPEASMAPFAVHKVNILLHLSALAKHTGNIEREPNIGLMVCTPESIADSPLALPRITLQGQLLPVGHADLAAAKAAYLTRIPDAEQLFSFADFRLFQFSPARIHWVGGFGSARKVSLAQWKSLTSLV